jgi:siroheme synthase (precorrin-2 oxidase/ferrochelatase)
MKTIRLDIELYLQGCLGASLEEKGWMGNDGRRRQREREREKREREKRERERWKKCSHGLNFPPVVLIGLA